MSQVTLPEIELMVSRLSTHEQLLLVERIAQHLRAAAEQRAPQDLYGAFKGRFPENFDVDAALQEIRTAWRTDLDEDVDAPPSAGEGER